MPHRFAEGHLRTSRPGVLVIRTELQGLSKKYGKSQIAAGIALTLLYADGEPAAEIHGAAADRDQASIVFKVMD